MTELVSVKPRTKKSLRVATTSQRSVNNISRLDLKSPKLSSLFSPGNKAPQKSNTKARNKLIHSNTIDIARKVVEASKFLNFFQTEMPFLVLEPSPLPTQLESPASTGSVLLNKPRSKNTLRLKKLVGVPGQNVTIHEVKNENLSGIEIEAQTSVVSPNQKENNQNDTAKQFDALSKFRSFLVPTYANLQLQQQNQNQNQNHEKSFAFGQTKGKPAEFLDSSANQSGFIQTKKSNHHFNSNENMTFQEVVGDLNSEESSPQTKPKYEALPPLPVGWDEYKTQVYAERKTKAKSKAQARRPSQNGSEGTEILSTDGSPKYLENARFSNRAETEGQEDTTRNYEGSPTAYYHGKFVGRFHRVRDFLKYSPQEQRIIEESFQLRNGSDSPTRQRIKKRETNPVHINQMIEDKIAARDKPVNLAETELFSGIREFWNSGPNEQLSAEQKQKLLFKVNDVIYFNLNPDSPLRSLIATDNKILQRDLGLDDQTTDQPVEQRPQENAQGKDEAILAQFVSKHQVIQPKFMKEAGSMCFTEFWSNKQRDRFTNTMGNKVQTVKVFRLNREDWDSVYRPKRAAGNKLNNSANGFAKTFTSEFRKAGALGDTVSERLSTPKQKNPEPRIKLSGKSREGLRKIISVTEASMNKESQKHFAQEGNTMMEQQQTIPQSIEIPERESFSPRVKKSRFSSMLNMSLVSDTFVPRGNSDLETEESYGNPKNMMKGVRSAKVSFKDVPTRETTETNSMRETFFMKNGGMNMKTGSTEFSKPKARNAAKGLTMTHTKGFKYKSQYKLFG